MDNLPNYLDMHNIDPGRVEPAHIDAPPGFDSIRPGKNIGTVAVVGRGRRELQPLTMSNADAIRTLENIETDIYGQVALLKAISALRLGDKINNPDMIWAIVPGDDGVTLKCLDAHCLSSEAQISIESGIEIIDKAIGSGKQFPLLVPFKRLFGMSQDAVHEIQCGMKFRGYNCRFESANALAFWFEVSEVKP